MADGAFMQILTPAHHLSVVKLRGSAVRALSATPTSADSGSGPARLAAVRNRKLQDLAPFTNCVGMDCASALNCAHGVFSADGTRAAGTSVESGSAYQHRSASGACACRGRGSRVLLRRRSHHLLNKPWCWPAELLKVGYAVGGSVEPCGSSRATR